MRLKSQSLIALGISTIIFSGCTSSGGGFLNLGIADALRKSKVCTFKKKLTYSKQPVGSTGLSLPTIGSYPSPATGPVKIDNYEIHQAAAAPHSVECGCGTDSVSSTEQFFMPHQPYIVDQSTSDVITQPTPTETITPPMVTLPYSPTVAKDLPTVNPLPSGNDNAEIEVNDSNFEKLDTEGALEPLGKHEKDKDFELNSQEEIAEGQREKDQSIFEQAELSRRAKLKFDSNPDTLRTKTLRSPQESPMLTLHARPAQSHNLFDRSANARKVLETAQASHKPYYRQQNSLRQRPPQFNDDRGYRQARNTTSEIEFKPLPPVSAAPQVEVLPAPKTKMRPLQDSKINHSTKPDEVQNSNTRTAQVFQNETAQLAPRVPILRATTVSSASIFSLKNLANVIEDKSRQEKFYENNRHTAQGLPSSSIDVSKSGEATVER